MGNTQIKKITQLTAVGLSSAVDVAAYKHHTVQYIIANVNTSVDINVSGSLDGNDYFDLESSDVQKTGNGTFYLNYKNLPLAKLKFEVAAEAGGTTVTVDATVMSTE